MSSTLWTPWCRDFGGSWILPIDCFRSLSLAVIRLSRRGDSETMVDAMFDVISDMDAVAAWSALFFLCCEEMGMLCNGFSSLQRWFNRKDGWRPVRLVVGSIVDVVDPLGVPVFRWLSWPFRRHTLHRQKDCSVSRTIWKWFNKPL